MCVCVCVCVCVMSECVCVCVCVYVSVNGVLAASGAGLIPNAGGCSPAFFTRDARSQGAC